MAADPRPESCLAQDALKEAGCEKIYIEQMSAVVMDRPGLCEALGHARSGDTLIVWKLDRLARSMKQLIETNGINGLRSAESGAKVVRFPPTPRDTVTIRYVR